jgi:cyclophilin family peptidyl-prolyl cis-trans isomerase
MKNILSGIIIFGIMASATLSFHSCSCGRNNGEAELDDSTKTALEMERKLREEPEFEIKTTHGTMKLRLYSQTPKHRENFVKLVKEKYYDGIRFHRVIEGFMIQAGDPFSRDTALINSWGTGGPDYTIPAEFIPEYTHKKGAIAAARKGDMANPKKASSGSQFYIVHNESTCCHLDGQYTVFGEVYEGLEVIYNIAMVDVDRYDRPYEDVIILSITQLGLPEEPKDETADTTKAE